MFGAWTLDASATMDAMLGMGVRASDSLATQTREGLVYKRLNGETSFKGISNVYLAKSAK